MLNTDLSNTVGVWVLVDIPLGEIAMKNTPSSHRFPIGLTTMVVFLILLIMVARANVWFFENDIKQHIERTWGGTNVIHSFTSRRFIDNSIVSFSINGETVHFCIDGSVFSLILGPANVRKCK